MKTTALLILLSALLATPAKAEPAFFVNANLGVFKSNGFFYDGFQFDYGGKLGIHDVTAVGNFSHLAIALAVNHSSDSSSPLPTSNTELMLQPLFTDVGGSNFFFAPQIGVAMVALASDPISTQFSYGLLAGWAFPITDKLSIAPEANLIRYSYIGESQTVIKLLAGVNYAF